MSARPTSVLMTAEEFAALPRGGDRHELIEGVLHTMPPPGSLHGYVTGNALFGIRVFIAANSLGTAFPESGYRLASNPDTVRAPDAAFFAPGRLPPRAEWERYLRLAPDLGVEVISPDDRPRGVAAKAAM